MLGYIERHHGHRWQVRSLGKQRGVSSTFACSFPNDARGGACLWYLSNYSTVQRTAAVLSRVQYPGYFSEVRLGVFFVGRYLGRHHAHR